MNVTPKLVTIAPCSEARPRTDTASLIELGDRLLVAYHGYRAGPEGGGDFGDAAIYFRESSDGGATWSDERLVLDNEPGDVNAMVPALLPLGDELLLGCTRNHTRSDSSLEVRRSQDGGATFGDPDYVWRHCEEHRFGAYDGLLKLQDGRLFTTATGSKVVWKPEEKYTVTGYASEDLGHTWRQLPGAIDVPMRGAMEPSVVQMPDGELVCSLRTRLGRVFITRSQDVGESWEPPQPSGPISPESCTCLARIPDSERLVLFWNNSPYVYNHHHYGLRTPISAAVSDDRGRTWSHVLDIESHPNGEYTNMAATFLADGRAALTYMAGIGKAPGDFNRTCLELNLALIPGSLLSA